jgi:predicted RNA binding protein YcfA (HicA-like mRNA interferase family)
MTARDLRRIPRSLGSIETRQRGSHVRIECGKCVTTMPVHAGEDIGPGLLRRIERDLEPCLGKGWLKSREAVSRDVRAGRIGVVGRFCPRSAWLPHAGPDRERGAAPDRRGDGVVHLDNAPSAKIVDDVKLPAPARQAIRAYATLRKRAEQEDRRAALAARRAVRVLSGGRLKMSARDAACVLGLSHQRVHQLAQEK